MNPEQPHIGNVDAYRRSLQEAGEGSMKKIGKLERSKFFRYSQDIQALQSEVSNRAEKGQRTTILEFGIGNLEEPLSYLAALYPVITVNGQTLDEAVDLTMVELRSRKDVTLTDNGLGSTYEDRVTGAKIGGAFLAPEERKNYKVVPLAPKYGLERAFQLNQDGTQYEFHSDILSYLQTKLDDPSHGKFDTALENYIDEVAKAQFDVIACNNVLQHLGGEGAYPTPLKNKFVSRTEMGAFYAVVTSILDRVKHGGLLIMHTDGRTPTDTKGLLTDSILKDVPLYKKEFRKEGEGLYRRLTSQEIQERFEKRTTVKGRTTSIRTKEAVLSQKDQKKIERIHSLLGEQKNFRKMLIESGQLPRFEELRQKQQQILAQTIDAGRLGRLFVTGKSKEELDRFYKTIPSRSWLARAKDAVRDIVSGGGMQHARDVRRVAHEYGIELLYYPGSGFDTTARDAVGSDHVVHLSKEENRDVTPGYFEMKRAADQAKGIVTRDMNVVGDFRDSPFRDGCFDAILVKGIPTHYAVDSVEDFSRVVKEKGYIFLAIDTMQGIDLVREKIAAHFVKVGERGMIDVFQKQTRKES